MDITGYRRLMYDTTEINDILTKAKNLNIPSDVTELIADIDDIKQKDIEQDDSMSITNQKLQDVTTKCLYLGKTYGTNEKYIALTDKLTAYKDGVTVTIVPHVDSGDNPTLNINELGEIPLLDLDERPVDLKANKPYTFVRVGSSFFISSGGNKKQIAYSWSVADVYQPKDRGCTVDDNGYVYAKGPHYSGWYVAKYSPSGEVVWDTEIVKGDDSTLYTPINFIYEGYLYSFTLVNGRKLIKLTLDGQVVSEYPGIYGWNQYFYKIDYKKKTIYTEKIMFNFETGVITQYPTFELEGVTRSIAEPRLYSNDNYHLIFGTMNDYYSDIWIINNDFEIIGHLDSGSNGKFFDAILLKDCLAVSRMSYPDKYATYTTFELDNFKGISSIRGHGVAPSSMRLRGEVYLAENEAVTTLLGKSSLLEIPMSVYDCGLIQNDNYILRDSTICKIEYKNVSDIL